MMLRGLIACFGTAHALISSDPNLNKCKKKVPLCEANGCVSKSSSKCVTCISGYYASSGKCISASDPLYNKCLTGSKKVDHCLLCQKKKSDRCILCEDGFILDKSKKKCSIVFTERNVFGNTLKEIGQRDYLVTHGNGKALGAGEILNDVDAACVNKCIQINDGCNGKCAGVSIKNNQCVTHCDVKSNTKVDYHIKKPENGAFRYNYWQTVEDHSAPVIFAIHGGGFHHTKGGLDPISETNPMDEFAKWALGNNFLVVEVTYSDYCYDDSIWSFLGSDENVDNHQCGNVTRDLQFTHMNICNGYDAAAQASSQVRNMIQSFIDADVNDEHYLKFDRNKIFVMGMSAGGFTTLQLAQEVDKNKNYIQNGNILGYIAMSSGWFEEIELKKVKG